jgi:hypothetical protein
MGSGWPSGHVAVDEYSKWPDNPGGNEICLNGDTVNAAELEAEIDLLIDELRELKSQVPKRFEQWKKLHR